MARKIFITLTLSVAFMALVVVLAGGDSDGGAALPMLESQLDPFGIRMIYPTKPNSSPWYMNQSAPNSDPLFDPGAAVTQNVDGSWRMNDATTRMSALTSPGRKPWKNVEMTGYVRLISTNSITDEFTWYARGERHTSSAPCEGSGYKGSIGYQGDAFWKKEVWHTGGYTGKRGEILAVKTPLQGRWVGWKVMMYNINADTAVKMETWIDDQADNQWVKVNEVVDSGGWAGGSTRPDCLNPLTGRSRVIDEVILWGGTRATFRADEAIFDFKWLSVREIETSGEPSDNTPPAPPTNLRVVSLRN